MADYLTTSGINNLITSYTYSEQTKKIDPLNTKKTKYENLNNAWSDLRKKLESLKTVTNDLKLATSDTIFNSKKSDSSNTSFITATATKTASTGSYSMRVSQLAKGDLMVSNTMASSTAVTDMAGTHKFKMVSGEYSADVSVDLTGSETNETVMDKLADAINLTKASVSSGSVNSASTYTGTGTFKIDLNGTETSIDYDFSAGMNYSQAIDTIAKSINDKISGVTAEKVTDGSNVSLKLTVNNKSQYISISQTSGDLFGASNLNLSATKYISPAGISSAAYFSPSSGNSKFSLTAAKSGYDYRLQLTETSGSVLSFLGWNNSLLTNRTMSTNDTDAGFKYAVNSSTDNELNAKFTLNGINIQSNSNTVDTVVNGVTLNLKSAMATTDSTVSISVATDTDTIKGKIKDFVSKFNDVYTYIKKNYTSGNSDRGLFMGDISASSLMNNMKSIVSQQVSGISQGNLSYLSRIGVTFDPDSGLTMSDDTKLTNAITSTPQQIADMFNTTGGIGSQLYALSSRYVGADGLISRLSSTYSTNIKYLTDKITSTQSSIDKSAAVLRKQYQSLQTQLATLYTNSSFFSGMSSSGMY